MDFRELKRDFHHLYFTNMVQREMTGGVETWLGRPILKCPLDLWVYQEIFYETKPTLLIETGTHQGGSALYFAHIFDLMGHPSRVLSIDIDRPEGLPEHARIEFLTGSSVDPTILEQVRERIKEEDRVMVILDSDHHADHVFRELQLYSPLVTERQYLIVEDTNVSGNPIFDPRYDVGPMEAVNDFLASSPPFEQDKSKEKFLLTYNPGGYLRRI